jgi:hypothetical protein
MTPEEALRTALDSGDPDRIEAAIKAVDADDVRKEPPTLHASALWYASVGLRVFPLTPGTKIPFKGSAGFKDASTNPDIINGWWDHTPDSNIGIATGHLVDVVDIDGPLGQKSRAEHWDAVFAKIDDDSLGKVLTPRPGGMHIFVPATGEGNSRAIVPGVDYRGLGGYVVAPPSVITPEAAQQYDNHHPGTYRFLGTPRLAEMAKGVPA